MGTTGFSTSPVHCPTLSARCSGFWNTKRRWDRCGARRPRRLRSSTTASEISASSRTSSWHGSRHHNISMKILYCNKYSLPFSGTEAYLFELIGRMEARGQETALVSMDHGRASSFAGRSYLIPHLNFKDPQASFLKKARMAAHALYSPSARRRMRHCLADYTPDLAHVRGIYHHLSPSILWELKRQGVPVLYHLNDFKILCPNYNFVAHGRTCELCLGGNYFHAVTEKCHAGPRSSSAVLAAEAYLHSWLKTYQRCVDLFLAPTEFVRSKLIRAGFPPRQLEVLAHFPALPPQQSLGPEKGYILCFGRLSAEKGLDALARDLNLREVVFAGMVGGAKLEHLIAGCCFSVFPSNAYETMGKSILESYAWGRPVVASDLGSRREMVEQGVTGLLYPAGDIEELAEAIEYLFNHSTLTSRMGVESRRRLHHQHDPDRHLDALQEIYTRLAARKRTAVRAATHDPAPQPPPSRLRVAFIGGMGVVSKYRRIESY